MATAFFVAVLLVAATSLSSISVANSQDEEGKVVKVWVNTNSGIYWCPGSRWYGKTKQGKYMSECDAIKEGYRPAYKKPCGSKCQ
ncbi:MAG: hypothetical protein ACRD4U_11205 [Candidatus Acidiferrales bacterium]